VTKKLVILFSIFIAVMITGQGCYTIIKHPQVDYADRSPAHYSRNCYSCHETYTEYPYGHDDAFSPGYWELYDNWGQYYAFPWWWESYWWDVQPDNDDDYTPDDEAPDRRRGLQQNPWDRDWGPAGYDPITPGGSGGTVTKDKPNSETKTSVEETKPAKRRGLEPTKTKEKTTTDDKTDKTSTKSKTDK